MPNSRRRLFYCIIFSLLFSPFVEASPTFPISVSLDISKPPALGETAELTFTMMSLEKSYNMSNFSGRIVLSEGLEYVSGNLSWEGDLLPNQTVQFKAVVKAVKTGELYVYARPAAGYGDQIYLLIDKNNTQISKEPFIRPSKFASVVEANISSTPPETTTAPSEESDFPIPFEPANISELSLRPLPPDFGQNVTEQQSNITGAAATTTIFSEDFEGTFCNGCNVWTVNDGNSNNGYDYWDDTSYKAHAGSWSAWSAQIGSQAGSETSSNSNNFNIPDWNGEPVDWVYSPVTISSAPSGATVSSIDVSYLLPHTWVSDLQVSLTDQGVTSQYDTWVREGGTTDQGRDDDTADDDDIDETETGITTFNGKAVNQQWRLWAADYVGGDTGYIDYWSIKTYWTAANSQANKYDDNMDAYMRRTMDLTGYSSASLEFWQLMPSVEGSSFDYGQLKVNGAEIRRYNTAVTSWTKETIDLSSYAGSTITIEWNFHSDSSVRNEGWYIDDIKVVGTTSGEITVKGYFEYYNRTNITRPGPGVTVCAYDKDLSNLIDRLLTLKSGGNACKVTNSAGYYEIGPITNDDGWLQGRLDVFVRVIASNSAIQVNNAGDNTYDVTSSIQQEVPDGNVWFSTLRPDNNNNEKPAWWIFYTLYDGWKYLNNTFGYRMEKSVARWELGHSANYGFLGLGDNDGTHYHSGGQIHLDGTIGSGPGRGHANDEDVILHEYGHNVMYVVYGNRTPTSFCPSPHNWWSVEHVNCAWTEGWAGFFPTATYADKIFNDTTQDFWINYEDATDSVWWNPNPWNEGHGVEGRISASLWDIYDNADDGYDNFDDGMGNIWNVFSDRTGGRDNLDNSYAEFYDAWRNKGKNRTGFLRAAFQNTINYNNAPTVASLDQTPTTTYRTSTFKVYAHYSDTETSEGSLISTIEYQRPANDGWSICTELWDSGNHRWYCDITATTGDNQLGTWDFVTRVSDGMEESGWTFDFNTVTVLNNFPAVASLDKSAASLYRTQGFTIYLHGSDAEDAESSLTQRIQYQLPGNTGWNDCAESWDSPNHRWYCTVTATAADSNLGTWDIRGMVTDSDAGESSWTAQNDVVTVSNNQPSLSGIPDKNTNRDTTPPDNWIDLHNYASDVEDQNSLMAYSIISETSAALIGCSIVSNRYVDCGTPAQGQYGYSDVTVRVSDTDGGTSTDAFRVTVDPANSLPGQLCSSSGECTTNYCHGSVSNAKRCCSSKPADDGWYGGGDAGCGVLDDPSSQYRDYYCTPSGAAAYEATDTKDCDSQDTNICSLSSLEQRDYYVQTNANTCTYCSQTYEPDKSQTACTSCAGKKWGIGGEVSPSTCCGDDANEFSIGYAYCTGSSCSAGDESGLACCSGSGSCVYGKTCYPDSFVGDINEDNKNERCDSGTWREISTNYIVPRKKVGIGHGSSKNSSTNYNTEITVGRGPVSRNTGANYVIEIGYNHYFG